MLILLPFFYLNIVFALRDKLPLLSYDPKVRSLN